MSANEIKVLLKEYIKKKVIQVVEDKNKNADKMFRIYFMNNAFLGPSDELLYIKLFNYFKKLAFFTSDDQVTIPKVLVNQKDQQNLPDSTLKAPCLSTNLMSLEGSLNLMTPSNVDLEIVIARITSLAEVVSNFISVYSANGEPFQIVPKFMELEEFTRFEEFKFDKCIYKLEHKKLGLFLGAGTTQANAMLHALDQVRSVITLSKN